MLIVAHAEAYKWKPNEAYFLQAIGDQMLMSVSHTRLRSLVRRMAFLTSAPDCSAAARTRAAC